MGLIRVRVNLRWKGTVQTQALVDTGSSFTVIPRAVARQLGLTPRGAYPVELADGTLRRLPAATVEVKLDGRRAPTTALVAPKGEVLIGAETLETLGLLVDPKRKRLKAAFPFRLKAA